MEAFASIVSTISGWLYGYILIALLIGAGLYFTIRTKFVQFRLLGESIRVIKEPKKDEKSISSFQALMVSTASRVGTGNIVGVTGAIIAGGPGAVFWMWIIALVGGASAFIESTLAQIYKKKGETGSYGGPAYYIKQALHSPALGGAFAVALILTYMGGFNALASYNMTDFVKVYFPGDNTTLIIGAVIAVLAGIVILGGGKRISQVTQYMVPIMAMIYIAVALIVVIMNIGNLPMVIGKIFSEAFSAQSVFGGLFGAAMMNGIKRGLYSNEAGIGSAPNAAASADVSHPVKQGLVQMLSVFLDTLVICTATAFTAGSQPLLSRVAGIGLQTWDQSNCPELTDHGLVPLRCGSAREPKRPGEARTAHPPASRREDSSREGPVWQALSGHKRSNTLAVELPPQARGTGTLIPSVRRLVWAGKHQLGNAAWGASFPSERALPAGGFGSVHTPSP